MLPKQRSTHVYMISHIWIQFLRHASGRQLGKHSTWLKLIEANLNPLMTDYILRKLQIAGKNLEKTCTSELRLFVKLTLICFSQIAHETVLGLVAILKNAKICRTFNG